jgi:hypothetical protein
MRTSITLKPISLTEATGGKPNKNMRVYPDHLNIRVMMTQHISEQSFWKAIKKVGWKKLWRIRSIHFFKPLKIKYTQEANNDLTTLYNIDLEKELLRMMSKELDVFRVQQDLEYINRHQEEFIKESGIPPEYLK